MDVWKEYAVRLQFSNEFMGGVPKNKELIKGWLEAKEAPDADANAEEIAASVQEATERSWNGFQSPDGLGLCIRGFHVKAHIKDCANILKEHLDVKALRSKVADRCYVVEDYIPLGKAEPDGYFEHPVHVMTAQGPRNALKRTDYVDAPTVEFTLRVLRDKVVGEGLLQALFEYGGTHGMGAERGMGFGRYRLETLAEKE